MHTFWEDLIEFLQAIGGNWVALTSGALSVVLTLAGVVLSVFWIGAALCFLFAVFWAWRIEHQRVVELTEKFDVNFSVHGIPRFPQLPHHDWLVIPEVTIVNRSH
ncbi:MAG TPA: hypothetical protein VGX03_16710 [Candidatus Binatia bacterium]|jgi:hypothetical protein|nr:hypothetical protein [Candidatus Binatia bacterium]